MPGALWTKPVRLPLQLLPLLAVTGNQQLHIGHACSHLSKGGDQRTHVLYRGNSGGNAENDLAVVPVQTQLPQEGPSVRNLRRRGKINTVINGKNPLHIKAPAYQQLLCHVRHRHPVVHPPQGKAVDAAVGQIGHEPSHIIQLRVGMNRRKHRQTQLLQKHTHGVSPGSVAMDQLELVPADNGFEFPDNPRQILSGEHPCGDPHPAGILGKGSLHEAHQKNLMPFPQALQQRQHMGLGPSHVAAGNDMNDSHVSLSNSSKRHRPAHLRMSRRRARFRGPSCIWFIQDKLLPQP